MTATLTLDHFADALASPGLAPEHSWRPLLVRLAGGEHPRFSALCRRHGITILDTIDRQLDELASLRPSSGERPEVPGDLAAYGCWAYLPWTAQVAHLLPPDEYLRVVTDRNRNKITRAEQLLLRTKRVGVLGLSVGAEAAVTIAQEHLCGHLVLADYDRLELSNLNRLGAGHADIGQFKTRIAARRIAAIDPYLQVTLLEEAIDQDNVEDFLHGLDLLVEECDGAAAKYDTRTAARRLGLNVVYAADERGFLSVEPYATHPELPPFHGLVGPGLATSADRFTALVAWLGGLSALSARSQESVGLIGTDLSGYPQLAGEARYAAGQIAHVARRLLLGERLPPFHGHLDLSEAIT
ncbi:ThiF family adenylyltransferase [Nonomuraea jiangxiensis]|uniref:ThiF family protein n=1 Tax=Nonomuraea jiangxiensis TaxID=633440 RepID=A0A1G9MG21_9ACTN|nr:ThiF family adenylyltransferase [Nonomuraea jiangxiensis]SDL73210.1 ThiF family protein [Nonomuraea jiangxiensis]